LIANFNVKPTTTYECDEYLKVILECDDKENSKVIFYDKAYEFWFACCDCKVYITKERYLEGKGGKSFYGE
jgi:hypothetical protein